ncbi:hypothetical protein OH736_45985 (plasmid) [Streptomyces sp. NBC_01650]|uniref:hypothetical protein n=1 Tax=Streptomyces sp. NBC_01650 TaxID=2975907 RepID=UPI002F9429F1|nr:hypothetical protein OH736_45985 [Streptomyces sp. NBC_01650]
MSRKKLERSPDSRPVSELARLRAEIGSADRFITWVTWSCAAGMVLWSMLNATPYVRSHVAVGWESTAFVLPLVVDAAFIGALRADEIASRHGVRAGAWPVLLRLFTGASSVFLNIGGSWEKGDRTGVFQHLVAPGLLVLLAEAGPAWRRSLAAKLAAAERTAEQEQRREADRQRRQVQEDADRAAREEREDADRKRAQRLEDEQREREQRQEDEQRALDLEEKREANRAARKIEERRLDLEEKRLTTSVHAAHSAADGTTAHRYNGTTAQGAPAAPVRVPVAPAPRAGVLAPQARTGADSGPVVAPMVDAPATAAYRPVSAPVASSAPRTTDNAAFARPADRAPARKDATASVAAAHATAGRVSARVDVDVVDQESPAEKAGPVKDWDLAGLPADCAPGRAPELLTDTQAHARIRYGHKNGWSQRRVATFAGRSPSTIHKHYSALVAE